MKHPKDETTSTEIMLAERLQHKTGAGMMECLLAIKAAKGDYKDAVKFLACRPGIEQLQTIIREYAYNDCITKLEEQLAKNTRLLKVCALRLGISTTKDECVVAARILYNHLTEHLENSMVEAQPLLLNILRQWIIEQEPNLEEETKEKMFFPGPPIRLPKGNPPACPNCGTTDQTKWRNCHSGVLCTVCNNGW